MSAYYNENDPNAAAWLRGLIDEGLIADGVVDQRDIMEVSGDELDQYKQCHFFAGIGGWSYALRLAGYPDDVRVWTGSCPCQPLSCAGQRAGEMDERHLWPEFYRLIAKCRPATVFGEQVASNDGIEWLDGISLDLEELGYEVGAADLPAACAGAPHERQRLFWVAHARSATSEWDTRAILGTQTRVGGAGKLDGDLPLGFADGCDAHAERLDDANSAGQHGRTPSGQQSLRDERSGRDEAVGDAACPGQQEQWRQYRPSGEGCSGLVGFAMQAGVPEWNGPTIAVRCSDGSRRVSAESGAFPLAHGLPARMGRLRGYGNAIVPQVAAKFIRVYLETCAEIKQERV